MQIKEQQARIPEEQARKDAMTDAKTLLEMGSVSGVCRGRMYADKARLVRLGLARIEHVSAREYVLVRTRKGDAVVAAFRAVPALRGER